MKIKATYRNGVIEPLHIECLQEDGEVVPKSTSKLPDQTPLGVSADTNEYSNS